jgi:hypothetical protein
MIRWWLTQAEYVEFVPEGGGQTLTATAWASSSRLTSRHTSRLVSYLTAALRNLAKIPLPLASNSRLHAKPITGDYSPFVPYRSYQPIIP